ncbi:MAG TPA: sigma 54-interacting transcriptional regulator [Pirellulales bacterium]|jgi:Nif-specific regulatory protein|nr:sigma 54-interacting transcriptional regulator [Pirellulales bacterium]
MAARFVYIYLTMTVGHRAGMNFLLDPTEENRIGRDSDCAIALSDPLCSRVHAIISQEDGAWHIRDAQSRNGTFVNNQKIDEAMLDNGHLVRIGSTEFEFHRTDQPPTIDSVISGEVTETLIKNQSVAGPKAEAESIAVLSDARRSGELLLLYRLSVRLLGCESPDDVASAALELLVECTKPTVAGFLWLSDDGDLKPRLHSPPTARQNVTLSKSLTDIVFQQRQAVWVANHGAGEASASLEHYADALCVPLVHGESILGAIHVYLEHGRFRQSDFDFTISLANITTVALVRASRQRSLTADYQNLRAKLPDQGEIIGHSPAMLELKSKIHRMSRATGCVLITGESGTGKELIARALHHASSRADRPMLCVNCAAIPTELMDSQLFGHKAGAFTSADRDHVGFFQQADLGTLFLDEVGEMTLEGQAKLLRILEGHPFLPVGGQREVNVDVRVIAATNQDLQTFVRERKFREDLYYRLAVFSLRAPPLRERGEDVGLLVDFFLDHFRRQHGRPTLHPSAAAREKLLAYEWPGNVRQLRNVIDSAVVLAEDPEIKVSDLGLHEVAGGELESLKIDFWERRLIREALHRAGGNVPDAAHLLGIGRATLYRKLEQYDIAR